MKKMFATVLTVIFALSFTCFSSTPTKEESTNIGMIENATPENSVLVYGFSSEPDIQLYYVDTKNKWEALISTGDRCFSLPPAHKGAKLVVKASSWQKSGSTTTFQGTNHYITLYEVQNDEWNVNVPTDKPIYFMGFHSIMQKNIMEWESLKELQSKPGTIVVGIPKTEEEYKLLICKYELKCLKKLLKKYKGTAWEAPINERINELKQMGLK